MRMIEEHRADIDMAAQQGCPYSPKDLDILSLLENYLRSFDSELENVAGCLGSQAEKGLVASTCMYWDSSFGPSTRLA